MAEKYKSSIFYSIKQLIHNNKILENDDSSIDCILEGDSIKIIEFLDDCDLAYYDSLLLKYKNLLSPEINVVFSTISQYKVGMVFPEDITGIEMKKSFCSREKFPFKYIKNNYLGFEYNGKNISDNQILKNIFITSSANFIYVVERQSVIFPILVVEGKRIRASFYSNNEKKRIFDIDIGTLNQIKKLYSLYIFRFYSKGIIYPGGIEIKKDDERTFSEIGIRNNFKCILFGNSLIKKNKK